MVCALTRPHKSEETRSDYNIRDESCPFQRASSTRAVEFPQRRISSYCKHQSRRLACPPSIKTLLGCGKSFPKVLYISKQTLIGDAALIHLFGTNTLSR